MLDINMKSYNEEIQPTSNYNSDQLFNRNFIDTVDLNKQKKNINRVCLERNFENSDKNEDIGEITGDIMDDDNLNHGMPVRSSYNPKKPMYDANKYLDFNVYHNKPKSKKLEYNESGNYASFAEISSSMIQMTQQVNPTNILSNNIENLGSRLFESILESLPENNFCVFTYGLYSLFAILYLSSDNITQNETQKFFELPPKKILTSSLNKLNREINLLSQKFKSKKSSINIKNLLIIGNNIPYNADYINKNGEYYTFARVNIQEPVKEAIKLSHIINKLMDTEMRNPITPPNIENLQIMLMTIAVIRPIWNFPFDKKAKSLFYGYDDERKQDYLVSNGNVYRYFEDNEHQLIELECGYSNDRNGTGEKGLIFGILLHKKAQTKEPNHKIHFYLEHMKPTILEEVRIPIFTQNLKFRYNGTLKNMGLNTVFKQITANNLFPNCRPMIHDVIQNVKIIVSESSNNYVHNKKGAPSMSKFLANKPFFYYIRLADTNTILMDGLYQ
jgi:serine protease inhibitor